MTSKLSKLEKVGESFTVNRYDNGFMVEVNGRDSDGDWKTCKILCNTETDLFEVIRDAITMKLDN